ncbi:hypothetical protein D3C72_1411100 [compost metagenome]
MRISPTGINTIIDQVNTGIKIHLHGRLQIYYFGKCGIRCKQVIFSLQDLAPQVGCPLSQPFRHLFIIVYLSQVVGRLGIFKLFKVNESLSSRKSTLQVFIKLLTTAHHIQYRLGHIDLTVLCQRSGQPEHGIVLRREVGEYILLFFFSKVVTFCRFGFGISFFLTLFFFFLALLCFRSSYDIFKRISSISIISFVVICLTHQQVHIILPFAARIVNLYAYSCSSDKGIHITGKSCGILIRIERI